MALRIEGGRRVLANGPGKGRIAVGYVMGAEGVVEELHRHLVGVAVGGLCMGGYERDCAPFDGEGLEKPDAVFCGNDTMALGVIRALTERGLRVPGDVSIIGFDDVPEAGYYLPPLTTVRQDFGVLGRQALSTLVDRMSGAIPAGRRVRVAPELIVRASAAGPG